MDALGGNIRELFGNDVTVTSRTGASGGCINDTTILSLSNGEQVFLKTNRASKGAMFETEKRGLELLREGDGPRVPEPYAAFADRTHQYLLMEYIPSARPARDYPERFGRELAALHRTTRSDMWGLEIDNFIGATPQVNTPKGSWLEFYAECRLRPQIDMARKGGLADRRMVQDVESIIHRMDMLLIEPEESPTAIHGDLWSGNAMTGPEGEPVIIDPAAYYGHREAELAMTELFGRQPGAFYDAYEEAWPLEPGYRERKDLYNLYHMLNHLNLFGGGYGGSVRSIASRYL